MSEISAGDRRRFESLLSEAMKLMARKPLTTGDKPFPEFAATFRAGFKCALILFDLIEKSTSELTPDEFQIIIARLEDFTGAIPPPPEQP